MSELSECVSELSELVSKLVSKQASKQASMNCRQIATEVLHQKKVNNGTKIKIENQ